MTEHRTAVAELFLRTRADASEADAVAPLTTPTQSPRPSWNNSTMLLQTLHNKLIKQGWGKGTAPQTPEYYGDAEELPKRPSDFGVGRWR